MIATSPKIKLYTIDDEVIRESSVLVERVAALSGEVTSATSLLPEQPAQADELIAMCNGLPKTDRSKQLDEMIRRVRVPRRSQPHTPAPLRPSTAFFLRFLRSQTPVR
jgi:hypothetical protein